MKRTATDGSLIGQHQASRIVSVKNRNIFAIERTVESMCRAYPFMLHRRVNRDVHKIGSSIELDTFEHLAAG